jgi:hypothetical protein
MPQQVSSRWGRAVHCPPRQQRSQHRFFVLTHAWRRPIASKRAPVPNICLRKVSRCEPIICSSTASNCLERSTCSTRPLALVRNSLNTPALATMDFRVLKYFPFGGAKRLDLVAEAFNLFNSANLSQINPVFGSSLTPTSGFRQPIAGTGARQIQFSLDFEF